MSQVVSGEGKATWRTTALAGRRARLLASTAASRRASAEAIAAVLDDPLLSLKDGASVAVYLPLASEPDVSLYTESLVERGIPTVVPNLSFPGSAEDPFLPLLDDADELPPVGLVILPALGLDRSGARIGRGGGWYDQAIDRLVRTQKNRPALVGVCFDSELHKSGQIPLEPHDQRVDFIATPLGLTSANGS